MAVDRSNAEALLRKAEEELGPCRSEDLSIEVDQEIAEIASDYDLQSISRVLAIEPWGRSGSLLLASYFDGHDEVMGLPALRSNWINVFFAEFPALSLHDKLICYPTYDELNDPHSEAAGCGHSLFEGPFAISKRRYLAAALAVCSLYERLPADFANSRKGFFIAVHVVYNRALGRRPRTTTPLIVCAQHEWEDGRAAELAADFSDIHFIHTVRDPISSFDRLFSWFFDPKLLTCLKRT